MNNSQTDIHTDDPTQAGLAEVAKLPDQFCARIAGKVQHRVGDGPLADIPWGIEVQVDTAIASFVVSWTSEEQPVTVTLAKDEFEYYLGKGDIVVL